MSAAKAIIKTMTIGLTIVSFVAVAETYYDKKFYTASFMDQVDEVRIDINAGEEKRVVASKQKDLPLIHKIEMKNNALVNGDWMITRVSQFFEDKEEVVFDKFNKVEDKDAEVVVDFRMIDTSMVRINDDLEQTYMVSLLTENGTIALFKEFGEGYEVVEARRVTKEEKKREEVQARIEDEKKNKFDIRDDLYLVSAVDPKRNKDLLKGRTVEGFAYLKNGELILEGVQLHLGTQNQTESLSTEMRVKAHGTFNDENGNQGIITITSKEEIKVRFSTGVLAGALLNFATYDKKQEIERKFQQVESKAANPVENDDAGERREVGTELEELTPVDNSGTTFLHEDEVEDQYQTEPEQSFEESDIDGGQQVEQSNFNDGYEGNAYNDNYKDEYTEEYDDEYSQEYREDYQDGNQDRYEESYNENYQESDEGSYEEDSNFTEDGFERISNVSKNSQRLPASEKIKKVGFKF
ncbi:MAG: hypothetical protein CME63_17995 [Halobacteriovoraceae bacterium]|nr:hypothetical protein [Halobacteriovoraceae bacterium]|tara:strand:+ start:1489 stop:2889 length:1401 start_codon:yes stop_codon:yes gene_type:complete